MIILQKVILYTPGRQRNLVGPPGHQKMTHYDNRPGPGRNYRETTIFTFGRKVVVWQKIRFLPYDPEVLSMTRL